MSYAQGRQALAPGSATGVQLKEADSPPDLPIYSQEELEEQGRTRSTKTGAHVAALRKRAAEELRQIHWSVEEYFSKEAQRAADGTLESQPTLYTGLASRSGIHLTGWAETVSFEVQGSGRPMPSLNGGSQYRVDIKARLNVTAHVDGEPVSWVEELTMSGHKYGGLDDGDYSVDPWLRRNWVLVE